MIHSLPIFDYFHPASLRARHGLMILLLGLTLGLGACGQGKQGEEGGRHHSGGRHVFGGTMSVHVIHPQIEDVPITTTVSGNMSSSHSIKVTPQVSGLLSKVDAVSGQQVKAGQVLFRIDPAPFKAALASAEAKLKGDLAQQSYTKGQVQQLKPLVAKDYVTRQTYDQAVASAQSAIAQVAQDRAGIETAKLNLSYTVIRAPIDGRLGEVNLQAGNLVQANSTALVTLRAIDPLWVNFSLPQSVLPQLRAGWPDMGTHDPAGRPNSNGPALTIKSEDAGTTLGKGHLSFADNTVSDSSGSIKLQGVVDNPDGKLWPGQFVTVELELGKIPRAVVLPAAAIQLGNDGTFVYRVADGKVKSEPVTQRLSFGTRAALPPGSLPANAEIIFPVPSRLRPGMAVKIQQSHQRHIAEQEGGVKGSHPHHHPADRP